ncbi:MAG: sigma-70 family RNA polymerase sigma factor [Phycisphaerales bacterium]|nr:MAG: sigma-70 family RNA polymerase sigma factor [Phycisphaerales bacterium]
MLTRTSTQLLADLHDPARTDAWALFNQRYRPILVRFAVSCGLQEADAEDVAQEAMVEFLRAYRAGRYDRGRGCRLRDWLKGIAANRIREFMRRKARTKERQAPQAEDQTSFFAQIPDDSDSATWDREWTTHILSLCLAATRREFDENTSRAFELYAIRQQAADAAAKALGMSRNAVYIAKHRVVARLQELFADFDNPLGALP